jgi:hypothetical protein
VALVLTVFIMLVLLSVTDGFTCFGFFGRGDNHKYCEKCGRRVKEIGNDYDPVMSCLAGYSKTYRCARCGHVQTAHCYTYD